MNAPVYSPPQSLGSPTQQAGSDDKSIFDGASGSPGINFPKDEFGVWKGGIYTGEYKEEPARDYNDNSKILLWPSGDPKYNIIVTVLTQDRDTNNPLDDGRRRLFIPKWDGHITDSQLSVVKDATSNGFHRGGQIYMMKSGRRRGEKNERSVWQCSYTPPTAATLAALDNTPPQGISPAAAPQLQQQVPQYQQGYSQPAGQQAPPPSYASTPAASNHPQWGPSGEPQQPQNGNPYGQYQQQSPPQYAPQQQPQNGNPYSQYQQ